MTSVTTALLLEVSRRTGFQMIITGQWDNQVIKLFLPKANADLHYSKYLVQYEEYIVLQITEFMNVLTRTAQEIGLPL